MTARIAEAEGVPGRILPYTPMPIPSADAVAGEVSDALCNGDSTERQMVDDMVRDTMPGYDPDIHAPLRLALYFLLEHVFDQTGMHQPFVETEADIGQLIPLRAEHRSLVWAPNHTSNIDSPMVGVVMDVNGFGLPHFAAGANLMTVPFTEHLLMGMNCLKILRQFDNPQRAALYKQVLACTCRALTQREEDFIVFVESNNRAGARTRNGTLRLPDRLRVIEGIVDAEADAVIVPVAVSYSRVPETQKMITGSGTFSILRYPRPDPGPACAAPADATLAERCFARLLGRYRNTYGKACVVIGRPFSVKDLLTSDKQARNGDDAQRVGEEAMRQVARVKKVLPSQVVAEALEDFREVNLATLTDRVRREIDQVEQYHQTTYGEGANFSREFQGDATEVVEAGLSMLAQSRIVRRRRWFTPTVRVRERDMLAYYGNMADHRLFSADFREKVAVIGAGRWGYTLCHVIGEKFLNDRAFERHSIVIFDTREEITRAIQERRIHPHFSEGVEIPKIVHPKFSYKDAIDGAKCIVIATTSSRIREVVEHVGRYASRELDLVIATKGFDRDTLQLMPEVAREVLARFHPPEPIHLFTLSGANIAAEVIAGHPCATVIAGAEPIFLPRVATYFSGAQFRVYTNNDLIGTALAGAAKNPYATMYACAAALELGQNYLGEFAMLATEEIVRLAQAMGASARTFTEGHAWWPDFHATSLGGRSSRFGKLLGQHWSADRILKRFAETKEAAETYHSTKALSELGRRHNVPMPIIALLYRMVYEGEPATGEAFQDLLLRA